MTDKAIEFMDSVLPADIAGLSVLEFGDQEIMPHITTSRGVLLKLGKDLFLDRGVSRHVSIDWNGLHGAVPLDAQKPLPPEFAGAFDIITNFGFSEHVADQYGFWRNVFTAAKPGTVSIHELPGGRRAPGHRGCWMYDIQFFLTLTAMCRCSIPRARLYDYSGFPVADGWVMPCLDVAIRHGWGSFLSREDFEAIPMERVTEG